MQHAAAGSTAVERVLDGLTGSEFGGLRRRDRDLRAGLRIAALTLAALGDPEGAEAGDADLVALPERLGDRTDQRLDHLAGIGPGQAGALRNSGNQFRLVHPQPPSNRLPPSAIFSPIAIGPTG